MIYFNPEDFDCHCGCGFNIINPILIDMLDHARRLADTPFTINSGCRCEKYNTQRGYSKTSSHLTGDAVDISAGDAGKKLIIVKSLLAAGFTRLGIAKVFIHVDMSSKKRAAIWTY